MEEKKKSWFEDIKTALQDAEMENIRLGIEIGKLKDSYYYTDIIKFLNGTASKGEDIYFSRLKPIYDEFGYEKVNRILLELHKVENGGGDNE